MPQYPSLNQYLTQHTHDEFQTIQDWFNHIDEILHQAFENNKISIRQLVHKRTQAIDQILAFLWKKAQLNQKNIALFAVGGYGRQEVLPYADIDIMVLSESDLEHSQQQKIEQFITAVWNIKAIRPALSVRTFDEAIQDAQQDITIATALTEARLIGGETRLARYPHQIVAQTWTDENFYHAKLAEQKQRHSQYDDTSSRVEPDIKNSAGGLRDIHTIGWVVKRHFRVKRIIDLVQLGFLSEQELKTLAQAENFLWKIRYYLHRINKRDDNRLLFDFQYDIANKFGFSIQHQQTKNEVIELFMKQYYCMVQQVVTLNEMILSYFYEAIIMPLSANYQRQVIHINQHFKLVDGQLAIQHHRVFTQAPHTILELFVLWAKRPDVQGIRARTLRLLRFATKHIDEHFRQNSHHQQLFLQIFKANPEQLYPILVTMQRYGVLGHYIPAFGKIEGLMQYDLFHIYTVDAHTLLLIRNLARFSTAHFAEQFPVISHVYQQLPRYDVLFIASLFHDIAKGRDGDHCILGAEDVLAFCQLHHINDADAQFIAWLIRHHLLMSLTAQKQDISDPDIVQQFAKQMPSIRHLDYLYCLTVADINATNPKLWNSWRASLLRQLYLQSKELLMVGIEQPIDYQQIVNETKQQAYQQLSKNYPQQHIEQLWQNLGDDYFVKENVDDIVWHTQAILQHKQTEQPLVLFRPHHSDAVQIFIYSPDQDHLFSKTVTVLDNMNLNVLDAKIITSKHGFSLDSYVVLDNSGTLVNDKMRELEVKQAIRDVLMQPHFNLKAKKRRVPRQLRHFNIQTQVKIDLDENLGQSVIDIITLDQPGLLAKIGAIFVQESLEIHSARIATLGERAEDMFFITQHGQPLTQHYADNFAQRLTKMLDDFAQKLQINE